MSDLRKAAEMALKALEWNYGTDLCDIENCTAWLDKMNATISALRQALAPEVTPEVTPEVNEPEGWVKIDEVRQYFDSVGCATIYKTAGEGRVPLYTAPQREWVGLTDEELGKTVLANLNETLWTLTKDIEAKLKEKNT